MLSDKSSCKVFVTRNFAVFLPSFLLKSFACEEKTRQTGFDVLSEEEREEFGW